MACAAAERESPRERERERQTRNARLLFIFYLCVFYLALLSSCYRSFLSLLRPVARSSLDQGVLVITGQIHVPKDCDRDLLRQQMFLPSPPFSYYLGQIAPAPARSLVCSIPCSRKVSFVLATLLSMMMQFRCECIPLESSSPISHLSTVLVRTYDFVPAQAFSLQASSEARISRHR